MVACQIACLVAKKLYGRHGNASCDGDVVMVVKRMVGGSRELVVEVTVLVVV